MNVVDTHVWIWWWLDRKKISKTARREMERSDALLVSAISLWEVALLSARAKVKFDIPVLDWMSGVLAESPFQLQPLTPKIADQAAALSSELLPDPADRLVAATALVLGCPLISADSDIHDSGLVQCIW